MCKQLRQRQRIGWKPFGGQHDRLHLVLAADQCDIQRIAGNAGVRVRDARNVGQRGMPPCVTLPAERYGDVGNDEIDEHDYGKQRYDVHEKRPTHALGWLGCHGFIVQWRQLLTICHAFC